MTHHNKVINDLKLKLHICYAIGFFSLVGLVLFVFREPIISPCADDGCPVKVVYATEEKTELEEITAYIVKVFQPYGRQVAVKAIDCFISESGLRADAENWNPPYTDKNGIYHEATYDYGVVQLNNYWQKITKEQAFDYKFSVDKALKIWLSHGKQFHVDNGGAWYGKGCK